MFTAEDYEIIQSQSRRCDAMILDDRNDSDLMLRAQTTRFRLNDDVSTNRRYLCWDVIDIRGAK